MTALIAAETLVLALLSVLVVGLLRSHADILRALHDLGAGVGGTGEPGPGPAPLLMPAPTRGSSPGSEVSGVTPSGDAVAISVQGDRDTLLVFLSSGCLTCRLIWETLSGPAPPIPPGLRPVIVTRGEREESPAKVAALAAGGTLPVVLSSEAWEAYQVPVAPYFVHVGASGHVEGEGVAATWSEVIDLLGQAQADAAHRRSPDTLAQDHEARRHVAAMATDAGREARNDRELAAAGILPGDPRLHFPVHDPDDDA